MHNLFFPSDVRTTRAKAALSSVAPSSGHTKSSNGQITGAAHLVINPIHPTQVSTALSENAKEMTILESTKGVPLLFRMKN